MPLTVWFDGNVEEAMNFYVSLFKNRRLRKITIRRRGYPGPKGSVDELLPFSLRQALLCLNGGPQFSLRRHIVSFVTL